MSFKAGVPVFKGNLHNTRDALIVEPIYERSFAVANFVFVKPDSRNKPLAGK